MKKILTIIFAAVISSVILGGCSKDDDDMMEKYGTLICLTATSTAMLISAH